MSNPRNEKETTDGLEQIEVAAEVGVLIKPKNHAYHAEQAKTPEEVQSEKRFVRKIDLWILPLLSLMYFLASLVSKGTALIGCEKDYDSGSDSTVMIVGSR